MDYRIHLFMLFVLCVTVMDAKRLQCYYDEDCPSYAKCDDLNGCKCLYGKSSYLEEYDSCDNECWYDSHCPKNTVCKNKYYRRCGCSKNYKEVLDLSTARIKSCVECKYNDDCPEYAKCENNNCTCLYGGRYPSSGKPTICKNECLVDSDCPQFSACNNNTCDCKFGGRITLSGKLKSCIKECSSDCDCTNYAECDQYARCSCKYGGGERTNKELRSCSVDAIGIILGVVGVFAFITIVIVFIIRARRRRLLAATASTSVQRPTAVHRVAAASRTNPITYPVAQYQPVGQVNYGYYPSEPPPPYTLVATKYTS